MSQPANVSFKQLSTIYLAMIALGMGQTVVFAVLPMLGRELQLDQLVLTLPLFGDFALKELAITSLTSVASFTFFLTAPYWGRKSDRIGRKPIIIIGLVGYGVGMVIFCLIAKAGLNGVLAGLWLFFTLLFIRALVMAVLSATFPATSAYIIDVTQLRKRTKAIGRLSAANQVGSMVGPALGGLVAISYLAPMYVHALICFVVALLVWKFLPDRSLPESHKQDLPPLGFLDQRFRIYLLIGLFMFMMIAMVQQTLGFYFQDVLHLDARQAVQQFAFAMVISSMAMLVSQLLIVQNWNGHPLNLLRLGLPLVAVAFVLIANSEQLFWLLTGMGLFGLGLGMAAPGFNVTVTLTVSAAEQGALAGVAASAPGLGYVIGPLVGGYIYSIAPTYTYWLSGILLLVLTAYTFSLTPPKAWGQE